MLYISFRSPDVTRPLGKKEICSNLYNKRAPSQIGLKPEYMFSSFLSSVETPVLLGIGFLTDSFSNVNGLNSKMVNLSY